MDARRANFLTRRGGEGRRRELGLVRGLRKLTEAKMTVCVSSSFGEILVKFG